MIYIQTTNQGVIDLLNPKPDQIVLADCAIALAHLNRYTGHAGQYSVAQHSVHAAEVLRDRGYGIDVQRGGLLHDLHEAWFGDISQPMKRALRVQGLDLSAFEALHMAAVRVRFPGSPTEHEAVKRVDLELCVTEARDLLGGSVGDGWPDVEPLPGRLPIWAPRRAFHEFTGWAERLGVS